jgi:hypothetical protein
MMGRIIEGIFTIAGGWEPDHEDILSGGGWNVSLLKIS